MKTRDDKEPMPLEHDERFALVRNGQESYPVGPAMAAGLGAAATGTTF